MLDLITCAGKIQLALAKITVCGKPRIFLSRTTFFSFEKRPDHSSIKVLPLFG